MQQSKEVTKTNFKSVQIGKQRKLNSLIIKIYDLVKQIFHFLLTNVTRKVTNIEGSARATHS